MTSSSSLGLRVLRVVCILLYPLAIDVFIISIAALFYFDRIPILRSLLEASVSFLILCAALYCARYVSHKSAPTDYRPPASYDKGVFFIPLGGVVCLVLIFFPSISSIVGWVMLLTIVSGLYILIKTQAFYWRYFILIGLAFALAMAPIGIFGMMHAARHSQVEQTSAIPK
jgi:hypothetical protein